MKVVILQPSYIPWRGYFDQIHKADLFVFYDCVQYDDRGWRNRNKIKTTQGAQWITVPVNSKGCQTSGTAIKDIPIVWESDWAEKHRRTIALSYAKAPFFGDYSELLGEIYSRRDEKLSDLTCGTTEMIARALGIKHTRFMRSSQLPAEGTKTDRLLSILKHLDATHYISGPSAQSYMELDKFDAAGVTVEYMRYEYPEYPQLHGAFEPQVSVLDLLLNTGPDAGRHIWG
jgi:hypothetical protein